MEQPKYDDLVQARRLVLEHFSHGLRPFFMPVAYRPVPGYRYADLIDAGIAHVAMSDTFQHEDGIRNDVTGAHMYAAMAALTRYGMPAYCVGADLMQASQLSRLPGEMPMADLQMPFPAMAFILPQSAALRAPDGAVYQGLVIARLPTGPVRAPWHHGSMSPFGLVNQDGRTDVDLLVVCAWSADVAPIFGACRPWEGTIGQVVTDVTTGYGTDYSMLDGARPLPADDRDFLDIIASAAIKLVLFASQGPQGMVEDRQFIKRARFGVSRGKVELYEPRWLGRRYSLPARELPDGARGTHASPRMHWRCGHLRRIPCGPARQERRLHWIEPTLVCPAPEAMAS